MNFHGISLQSDRNFLNYTTGLSPVSAKLVKNRDWNGYNKPMSLTREDVIQIAHLARLSLTEEEIRSFQEQLSAILDHADRLKEVDTKGSLLPPRFYLPHPLCGTIYPDPVSA